LQRLAVRFGIPTFVFVQWIAPFLSEFPEKVTAFNWARQRTKAPMAVMNMVSSNINQWTLLAAMIPLVFSLSLGHFEPVALDPMHRAELLVTLAQSLLGGLLLLDLEFSAIEALGILILWGAQFLVPSLRDEVTILYLAWCGVEVVRMVFLAVFRHRVPRAFPAVKHVLQHLA
jgi:cation:H+ antiporter